MITTATAESILHQLRDLHGIRCAWRDHERTLYVYLSPPLYVPGHTLAVALEELTKALKAYDYTEQAAFVAKQIKDFTPRRAKD